MDIELKNAYMHLPLERKRNEISNELLIMGELIKKIENLLGNDSTLQIKNYIPNKELNEEEMLTFFYEDIYNIKRELLLICNSLSHKNLE